MPITKATKNTVCASDAAGDRGVAEPSDQREIGGSSWAILPQLRRAMGEASLMVSINSVATGLRAAIRAACVVSMLAMMTE